MDVGKFLRLQGAIRAAHESIPPDHAVMGGTAMERAYERLRIEVQDAIPNEHLQEFDGLFPEHIGGFGHSPRGEAERFHAARSLLASMAGWLDGYVQAARMEMEAQAYAEARVKEERGFGFKQPS